jgi:hypothetical protein
MSECLSPDTIDRYRSRMLNSMEERMAVEAHLAACPSCRQALRTAASNPAPAGKVLSSLMSGVAVCLDSEQLMRYVDGVADAADREIVETHCEDCPKCMEALGALRALHVEIENYRWPAEAVAAPASSRRMRWRELLAPGPRFALAGMAVLLMAALFGCWTIARSLRSVTTELRDARGKLQTTNKELAQQKEAMQSGVAKYQGQVAKLTYRVRELEHQIALAPHKEGAPGKSNRPDRLVHIETTPSNRQSGPPTIPTEHVISTYRLQQLALLDVSKQQATAERGGSFGLPLVTLSSPVGTLVMSDMPVFSWEKVEGATRYQVSYMIYDQEQAAIGNVFTVDTNNLSCKPKAPLKRGASYRWQVTAYADNNEIPNNKPIAQSPYIPFRVLEATVTNPIERERMTLGESYARAGLLSEAEREFQALLDANPQSTLAAKRLKEVQEAKKRFTH